MAKRRKSKLPADTSGTKGKAEKRPDENIDPKEQALGLPQEPPPPPDYPLVITGAGENPDPNITLLSTIWTRRRFMTQVGHALEREFSSLTTAGSVDAFIVSTEDGFGPLGANRQFFASELGIPEQEIAERADWNRLENERATLIALHSRRPGSHLKGLILAPGETSRCYEKLMKGAGPLPSRDFYYNVTYEAIAYASSMLRSRRLGIGHLSASHKFHQDIATCQAEALAHFSDQAAAPVIETFTFVGCCIEARHLDGIKRLNPEPEHRPIHVEGHIHLSWT